MAATSRGANPFKMVYPGYITEVGSFGLSPKLKEWLASWSATEYRSYWPGALPAPKLNRELKSISPDQVPSLGSYPVVSARSRLPAEVERGMAAIRISPNRGSPSAKPGVP